MSRGKLLLITIGVLIFGWISWNTRKETVTHENIPQRPSHVVTTKQITSSHPKTKFDVGSEAAIRKAEIPSENLPLPDEDPTVNRADELKPSDEVMLTEEKINGYPSHLISETKGKMTQELGFEPSDEEVLAHLDEVNEQIHEANQELAENFEELKKYYEEGNFEAMQEMQLRIFNKHVARLDPLPTAPENDFPSSWRDSDIQNYVEEQRNRYLDLIQEESSQNPH